MEVFVAAWGVAGHSPVALHWVPHHMRWSARLRWLAWGQPPEQKPAHRLGMLTPSTAQGGLTA